MLSKLPLLMLELWPFDLSHLIVIYVYFVQCCVHNSLKTIQWIKLRLDGKYYLNLKMRMWFARYAPAIFVIIMAICTRRQGEELTHF